MSNQSVSESAKNNPITLVARTLLLACALVSISAMAQTKAEQSGVTIATQLKEVQRGTIDGRDYLTLHIGGHDVGPSSCRSNVLRMDTSGEAGAKRQEEIEAIAISAMLSGSTVVIVVPLDIEQCVDGKPTFTDLYRLVPNPKRT